MEGTEAIPLLQLQKKRRQVPALLLYIRQVELKLEALEEQFRLEAVEVVKVEAEAVVETVEAAQPIQLKPALAEVVEMAEPVAVLVQADAHQLLVLKGK